MAILESDTLDAILRNWTKAQAPVSPRRKNDFRQFLDWSHFRGVAMPADAEDIGCYLLELLADGASLATLRRAADAIQAAYVEQRCYLNPRPIAAAIEIAANQLSANRVLN